jgi:hypothetical protein
MGVSAGTGLAVGAGVGATVVGIAAVGEAGLLAQPTRIIPATSTGRRSAGRGG